LGWPLVAARCACGKLTHRVRALLSPHGDRAWGVGEDGSHRRGEKERP
jgi:hypothetical protein